MREIRRIGWGLDKAAWLAVVILAGQLTGCTTTVYTVGPRCPAWSEKAEAELGAMMLRGDYPNLEEAIGRQELFCSAMEPENGREQCFGWWCWWRRLFDGR